MSDAASKPTPAKPAPTPTAPMRTVRIHARDRTGVALPAWRGCRRLAPDERLLLGDTPASLDSRYFGPVRIAQIEGFYRETLTW